MSFCRRRRHFCLCQLVWTLQEVNTRNFELVSRNLCPSFERLSPSALVFRLRWTLAPSSGVSWRVHSVRLHPGGGLRGAPKRRGEKERSKERERKKGKEKGRQRRREGKGKKICKRKGKEGQNQKKIGYKRKTHGWRPVSDNRNRLKEKEPMKKETSQERAPRHLKF